MYFVLIIFGEIKTQIKQVSEPVCRIFLTADENADAQSSNQTKM